MDHEKEKGKRDHERRPGDDRPLRHAAPSHLWLAAGAVAVWSFGYTLVPGSDLWWHLAAGRWMLVHRALPTRDPFSFTATDGIWRNHEWLADLVFAFWERAFGLESLVYWKWAVLVSTFLVLQRTLARFTRDDLASFSSVVFAAVLASPLLDIRPHLYSLLGFVPLLHATLGRPRPLRWLPLLFLVWANLHAGVVFGLLALGVSWLPAVLGNRPPGRRRALAYLGACGLASVVNPNGLGPLWYALRYAFDAASPFRGIVEWQSPRAAGALPTPLYPYAVGAVVGCVLYGALAPRLRHERRISWSGVALAALTLAMSLRSARFVALFAIAATLVVSPVLAAVPERARARSPRYAAPAFATLGFGAFLLARHPLGPNTFVDLTMTPTFPVETCNFVAANHLTGNVFALYGWGGYVQLRTAGRLRVFIDGRADTVYPDDAYTRYTAVAGLVPGWEKIVDESRAEYVLWPRALAAHWETLLASGQWRLLYADLVSVLLVRAEAVPARPLRPTPDSAYRRLALGWDAFTRGDPGRATHEFAVAETLDPGLTPVCYLLARAEVQRGDDARAKTTRARCFATFPRRDYLSSRLGLRPLPAALAELATSTSDPNGPRGSDSRSRS